MADKSGMNATSRTRRVAVISAVGAATLALAATGCASTSNSTVEDPAASSPSAVNASAGALNGSFAQAGAGLDQPVDGVAVQSDDKVVAGGRFTSYSGTPVSYIARFNTDGSLDKTFATTGGLNGRVRTVAVQSDGKILAGGEFTSFGTTATSYIVRLNSDGSLDQEFVAPKLSKPVWSINPQTDGSILVGGLFAKSATNPGYFMELNSDGSVNSKFASAGLNGYVKSSAVQADGSIVIGGSFTSPRTNLARLNADGTLDTSFAPKGGLAASGYVDSVLVTKGQQILIGGWFTDYAGTPSPRVARLDSDGSIDTAFAQTGTGLDAEVKSMALQSDQKLVVSGDFTSYNGTSAPAVARLNTDGSLDKSFVQTGKGILGNANGVALASDGDVVVAGAFPGYDSVTIANLLELLGSPSSDLPGAPQSVAANAAGKGAINVSWTAPKDSGSSAITSYTATASSKGQKTQVCTATAPALKCTISGVKGGPQYDVTVTATNKSGTGPASQPPVEVTAK